MPYPLPVFYFNVACDQFTGEMGFSEVTGLTQEIQMVEYRHGASKDQFPIKMPGLRKFANIMLKQGIVKGNNDFYIWLSTVKGNTIVRPESIIISLRDEEDQPVMSWVAYNPFPVKIEGPQLKASGNEVAIASIELAVERVEVQIGS